MIRLFLFWTLVSLAPSATSANVHYDHFIDLKFASAKRYAEEKEFYSLKGLVLDIQGLRYMRTNSAHYDPIVIQEMRRIWIEDMKRSDGDFILTAKAVKNNETAYQTFKQLESKAITRVLHDVVKKILEKNGVPPFQ